MSKDFEDMLYLFSCGALGKEVELTNPVNVEEIYKLAVKQGVWQIVFTVLEKLREKKQIEIDDARFDAWKNKFLTSVVYQFKKRNVINNVLTELEKSGIDAYVLKGDVVAQYYSEPLSRISSDTDIYVGENVIEAAEKVFEKCGFDVHARSPMEHHSVCVHPVGGSVDLHLTFHDDCFEEKIFSNYSAITEKGVKYKTEEGYEYYSLGVNDNAIFLFLHLVKHFLSCGTGIRQIMDFLLFWKNNRDCIDVALFKKMLDDLGFYELFSACVCIGIKYLQFDESDFADIEVNADDFFVSWLLMDIEKGGVFGKLEQRKLTIYYLFGNDAISNPESKKAVKYIKAYAKTFGYGYLSKKYPYVEKYKILMPVAYINRVYDLIGSAARVFGTMKKATKKNDEFINIENRMEIINKIYRKK